MEVLCPQNAPSRCPWCNGPYHIRKRCPKLAQLDADRMERKKQEQNSFQRQATYSSGTNSRSRQADKQSTDNQWHPANVHYRPFTHRWPTDPMHNTQPTMLIKVFGNEQRIVQQCSLLASNAAYTNKHHVHKQPIGCYKCGSRQHKQAHCPERRSNNSH
jgi:hypothetical protein